jgi:hypothetical protein
VSELPAIGSVFADRFKLLSPLGQGGMGVVYRAIDQQSGESCALKLLHPRSTRDPQARERFRREIRILRQLRHPHIVEIFDDGEVENLLFFTMELVVGPNLLAFVDSLEPLPLEQALLLFGQVCSSIDYAHGLGIIHRDLKPTNIIIQDGKRVKLLDFGLAREQDQAALTLPGQALGTAAYMAPEVGRGEQATPAADIYALGCIFFQLATGILPFVAENPIDLIQLHQTAEIPKLTDCREEATQEMDGAIYRALAKDPKNRFRAARRFYEALLNTGGGMTTLSTESLPSIDYFRGSSPNSTAPTIAEWQSSWDEAIPGVGVLGGWCVVPSPDRKLLAIGADAIEGPLLFDTRSQKWSRLGDHGAGPGVRHVAWARDGRHLAFVNSQRLVIVDMANNKTRARLDVSNHRPWRVEFLASEEAEPPVVAVGESGGAIVWRGWPKSTPDVFRVHQGVARALRVSPGGGTFVTGGLDGTLNFWKSTTHKKRGALSQDKAAFWDVQFSATGELLAVASSDQTLPVLVYRQTGNAFEGMKVKSMGRALSVAFSASERLLAVGGDGRVSFLDREGSHWIILERAAVDGEVRGICFGRGDRAVYVVTSKGKLIALRRGRLSTSSDVGVVFDSLTGEQLGLTPAPREEAVAGASSSSPHHPTPPPSS